MDRVSRPPTHVIVTSTLLLCHRRSVVSHERIDEINILQATLEGMRACVMGLMTISPSSAEGEERGGEDHTTYICYKSRPGIDPAAIS